MIVAFTKDWGDVPTCTTHVLREMGRTMPVLWVESLGLRRPTFSAGSRDLGRILRRLKRLFHGAQRKENNLWVLSPLLIPKPTAPWHVFLNRLLFRIQSARALRRMRHSIDSTPDPRLPAEAWRAKAGRSSLEYWCFVPSAVDLLPRHATRDTRHRLVYYCVDDWGKFENLDGAWLEARERALLQRADVVFTPAKVLQRKCEQILRTSNTEHQTSSIERSSPRATRACPPKPLGRRWDTRHVLHIPHGVEHAKFAAALGEATRVPADIAGLPKPVIGFYGNLYPWIDFALIAEMARRRPGWSFVLIGHPYCEVSRLAGLPNVRLLGRREHDDLPAYCKGFDAGIIPYDMKHPRMESVNPVKTRELLAAGVPVVAADIPELRGMGEDVRLCRGADEWLAAIEEQSRRTDRKEISDRVKGEDWSVKVAEMRRIVEDVADVR